MADILDIDTLLRFYFRLNVSQKYMLELLAYKHQIVISRRTLQRKLKNIRLYRKKNKTDLIQVAAFLQKQMEKSGCLHGYRWMYTKCCIEGLVVDRESVRVLLQIIDPEGVEFRKSRRLRRRIYFNHGPNYTWHIDSNDKLKPYGIFINGCVGGFSRHIIWLQASGGGMARSIAYYFIEAVKCRKGCPRIVRTDMGVENTVLHKMQAFLRRSHQDNRAGNNSVICGDSRANQRVEFWWSVLKKQCLQFWIDLFQQMQQDGYFSGDYLDKHLLRFCFLEIIQAELDNAAEVWNTHRIRSNRTTGLPCDKPVLLYTLPHLYGFDNLICQVDNLDTEVCEEECQAKNDLPCDEDLYELCLILMDENDWNQPEDPYEAVNLYQELSGMYKKNTL